MIEYFSALEMIGQKILSLLPNALAARRKQIEEIATYCQEISEALDAVADMKKRGELPDKPCAQLAHHRDHSRLFDVHRVYRPMDRLVFALPQDVKREMIEALNTALAAEYLDATDRDFRKASGIFLATAQQLRAGLLEPATVPQEEEKRRTVAIWDHKGRRIL